MEFISTSPRGETGLPALLRQALQAGFYMKFYFTYVLRSKLDNNLYVGWTNNLEKRVRRHNNGQVYQQNIEDH
jgi:hypothetical protein